MRAEYYYNTRINYTRTRANKRRDGQKNATRRIFCRRYFFSAPREAKRVVTRLDFASEFRRIAASPRTAMENPRDSCRNATRTRTFASIFNLFHVARPACRQFAGFSSLYVPMAASQTPNAAATNNYVLVYVYVRVRVYTHILIRVICTHAYTSTPSVDILKNKSA